MNQTTKLALGAAAVAAVAAYYIGKDAGRRSRGTFAGLLGGAARKPLFNPAFRNYKTGRIVRTDAFHNLYELMDIIGETDEEQVWEAWEEGFVREDAPTVFYTREQAADVLLPTAEAKAAAARAGMQQPDALETEDYEAYLEREGLLGVRAR